MTEEVEGGEGRIIRDKEEGEADEGGEEEEGEERGGRKTGL